MRATTSVLALTAVLLGVTSVKANDICDAQRALKEQGYYYGEIDCVYGGQMRQAILKFQKTNGLARDGVLGSDTRCKLFGGCPVRERDRDRGSSEREVEDTGEDSESRYEAVEEQNPGVDKSCKSQYVQATGDGRPSEYFAKGNARENWSSEVSASFGSEWARTKNARNVRTRCWEDSNEGDLWTTYKCRVRAIPCKVN